MLVVYNDCVDAGAAPALGQREPEPGGLAARRELQPRHPRLHGQPQLHPVLKPQYRLHRLILIK